MFEIVADHWYAWDFTVTRDGQPLTRLEMSAWRERGGFVVDGVHYGTSSAGFLSGEFTLEGPEGALATAHKPSPLRAQIVLHVAGRTLSIERRSGLKRDIDIEERGVTVGNVIAKSAWSRDAAVVLPDDLTLPVQLFVLWLALLLLKREMDAIVAASSS
jgi:hypothetical protein